MDGPPWPFGMNGLAGMGPGHKLAPMGHLDGWALSMDGPQWALGMDEPWAGIGLRDGWALMGPRDGCALSRDEPSARMYPHGPS